MHDATATMLAVALNKMAGDGRHSRVNRDFIRHARGCVWHARDKVRQYRDKVGHDRGNSWHDCDKVGSHPEL